MKNAIKSRDMFLREPRMTIAIPIMILSMGYILPHIRDFLGDHIVQHDIPLVPPCLCAGDTGKTQPE